MIAGLENQSTHPIATAFKDYYTSKVLVSDFHNMAGIGITGIINKKKLYVGSSNLLEQFNINYTYESDVEKLLKKGNSVIYVIEDGKLIAIIGIRDIIRENIKIVIDTLKKKHKEIIMLSGDNYKTAQLIAKQLGVMPSEKEDVVKKLVSDKHKVMMVGDGINDALALVHADVGVSIHSGTDIASDSADVILMEDDLSKVVTLLNISKCTTGIIKQNLFWAFIYNTLMIPIAVGLLKPFGITLNPMFAGMAMTISSLTVVFNSLRLKRMMN